MPAVGNCKEGEEEEPVILSQQVLFPFPLGNGEGGGVRGGEGGNPGGGAAASCLFLGWFCPRYGHVTRLSTNQRPDKKIFALHIHFFPASFADKEKSGEGRGGG